MEGNHMNNTAKVINFVKRRRKHSSKRTKGHRQYLTIVKVTKILEKGGDKIISTIKNKM